MKEKPKHELVAELPSVKSLYKQVIDYASRLLLVGKFRADFMLSSDQSHAVSACLRYAQFVLDRAPTVLIVREAQLIDNFSFRTLLGWQLTGTHTHLIVEYTTESGLHPAHQKDLLKAAELREGFSSLAIEKLGLDHFKSLVDQVGAPSVTLETEAYVSWDGNIRTIREVKFLARGGVIDGGASALSGLLQSIEGSLSQRILELPENLKMLLAFAHANSEPVTETVVRLCLTRTDPNFRASRLPIQIEDLVEEHRLLARSASGLRLENENVAKVIEGMPRMQPLIALAQTSLREVYRQALDLGGIDSVEHGKAVRQIFRLCMVTGDVSGLVEACDRLTEQVRAAEDHTIYLEAISTALVTSHKNLAFADTGLELWGARLAYEVSDWRKTVSLLGNVENQCIFRRALAGYALQEIGGHADALNIAHQLMEADSLSETWLAGRLLELIIRGCQGEIDEAKSGFVAIQKDSVFRASPLVGYAYRLMDIVEDVAGSLPSIERSVAIFRQHGLRKAEAYSCLAAAIPLARLGQQRRARAMLGRARRLLKTEVFDRHLVLNNAAAVELLSARPKVQSAIADLEQAQKYVVDDFSELTIVTNLAIAYFLIGRADRACRLSSQAIDILFDHEFADKDIYWPVVFNIDRILSACDQNDLAGLAKEYLNQHGRTSTNQSYWDFRFGHTDHCPEEYAYLAKKRFHPLYLSHWTVELEALEALRQGSI